MKKSKIIHIVVGLIVVVLVSSLTTFLVFNISQKSLLLKSKDSQGSFEKIAESLANKSVSPEKDSQQLKLVETDVMGSYSFSYPYSYHVAVLWPANFGNSITIAIDPKPINTAPRGGSLSSIMITDKSGLDNPDEVFEIDKNNFKNSLIDLEEEEFQKEFGTVYHYKGEINIFEEWKKTEKYFFIIPGQIPDNKNKHLITASLETDISNSSLLKRIVNSFKSAGLADSQTKDINLKTLAKEILNTLKNKDFVSLSKYIHPTIGLRFSPYASVSEASDLVFQKEQIKNLFKDNTVYTWGIYDGSGLPIELKFSDYYQKFIYDKDYAASLEVSENSPIGKGNSINNISSVYPKAKYIEFYVAGSNETGGLDWGSLRLVLDNVDGKWNLVGIVHDQWTI